MQQSVSCGLTLFGSREGWVDRARQAARTQTAAFVRGQCIRYSKEFVSCTVSPSIQRSTQRTNNARIACAQSSPDRVHIPRRHISVTQMDLHPSSSFWILLVRGDGANSSCSTPTCSLPTLRRRSRAGSRRAAKRGPARHRAAVNRTESPVPVTMETVSRARVP